MENTDPYIIKYTKSDQEVEHDRIEGKKMRFRINREEKYGWRSWFEPFGYNGRFTIRNELYLFKNTFSVELSFRDDCDHTINFHLCLPFLFSWYFSIAARFGYSDWWKNLLCLDSSMRQGRRFGIGWRQAYGSVEGSISRLAIDHDHKSGKVRDLLCFHCNTGIGLTKDNTDILQSAIEYIKKHNE